METTTVKNNVMEKWALEFELHKTALGHGRTDWAEAKQLAFAQFQTTGFPSKTNEEYKYTPLDALNLRNPAAIFSAGKLTSGQAIFPFAHSRIVLIDGHYQAEQSQLLDKGLQVMQLQQAAADGLVDMAYETNRIRKDFPDAFALLNSAFALHGAYIHLEAKTVLTHPVVIEQHFTQSDAFIQPMVLINAEKLSQAIFIESWTAHSDVYLNAQSIVKAENGSQIAHIKWQHASGVAMAVDNTHGYIFKDAVLTCFNFSLQGKKIRNNLQLRLEEPGASAHLYGFYHPQWGAHYDHHTLVDHRVPHCYSNELYKGAIGKASTAVFNGKVFVRKDAQKTNAYQSNKNILLAETASVYTKPQLEIYADDVKCSHGSSTGFLDEDSLFYLKSRGIGTEKAKSLLLYAFSAEVATAIPHESMRDYVIQTLENRFSAL